MGVWIRDKKHRQRGTGIKIADPRQDCYFDPAQEGLVEVQHKQVVDRLLAHPYDFEVAWEKHGVHFDASGKAMEPIVAGQTSIVRTPEAEIRVSRETAPVSVRRRGRPKKA